MGSALAAAVVVLSLGHDVPASLQAQDSDSRPKLSVIVEPPYRLRITAPTRCGQTATAVMFRRIEDRTEEAEEEVWRARLVNNPKWVWLDRTFGWFATLGNECSYAPAHAVVVYDASGRTVRDLQVGDFLTHDEMRRIGIEIMGDKPRTLRDDDRNGNDLGRNAARVTFTDDGVWLTHPRIGRKLLVARR